MKISYLITCHNEGAELANVIQRIGAQVSKSELDEMIVMDDFSTNEETKKILDAAIKYPRTKVLQHKLDGDFGAHKTWGSRQCRGDYIVQLDADEYLSDYLLENLRELLESNPSVDLYRVPRVNIVRGMTEDDQKKWGWKVYQLPEFPGLSIINWEFDHQARIYRNSEKIYWHKKLHETIAGAEYVAIMPLEVDYAIIHDKTIDRQRAQNEFYNKNWSAAANMGKG